VSASTDPPRAGLVPTFVGTDDTLPPRTRWTQLAEMGAIVGSCRVCALNNRHGDLVAVAPSGHDAQGEDGSITWYETRCLACGDERAAPNGRVMRRSARWAETPHGWLANRDERDQEQVKQRAGYDPDGHPADRPRRGR
jgi:hypothetical protein